jgi:hypothetical protein
MTRKFFLTFGRKKSGKKPTPEDEKNSELKRSTLIIILPRGYPVLLPDTKDQSNADQRKSAVLQGPILQNPFKAEKFSENF